MSSLVFRAIQEKRRNAIDKPAFTKLVQKYQDMVFGLAFAILQDHFHAQDVTQEVFLIAYNKLETLARYEAFPFWLQRIARRESIRTLKNNRTVRIWKPIPEQTEPASVDGLPEQILEREEARRKIHSALGNLPEGQRVPVVLYHIDGYSQGEIADFLELKTNTVKKRIQRGRESMQKNLMGMFENDLKGIRPSKDDRLIRSINLYTTFDAAAKIGQLELLEQMLVDGVEIDARDTAGRTLLHWAVENDHAEAVRLLLKYGADRSIVDRSRKTPYQLAKKRGNPEVLRLFRIPDAEKAGT